MTVFIDQTSSWDVYIYLSMPETSEHEAKMLPEPDGIVYAESREQLETIKECVKEAGGCCHVMPADGEGHIMTRQIDQTFAETFRLYINALKGVKSNGN